MNINKLTKKELRNLYFAYSNGELMKVMAASSIQVTASVYPVDKKRVRMTMDKIRKIMERKK